MEKLFNVNPLEGVYLEAFEEAKKEMNLDDKEAELLESVAGMTQIISNLEKAPLLAKIEVLEKELKATRSANFLLKAKVNSVEETLNRVRVERDRLKQSLIAMKEVSILGDKLEELTR